MSTKNEGIEEHIDIFSSLHSILQLRSLHFLASLGYERMLVGPKTTH